MVIFGDHCNVFVLSDAQL